MAITTIKATCDTCGDVEFTAQNLVIAELKPPFESRFDFICPECGRLESRKVASRAIRILEAMGVYIIEWDGDVLPFNHKEFQLLVSEIKSGALDKEYRSLTENS